MITGTNNQSGEILRSLNSLVDVESVQQLLQFHAQTNLWLDPKLTNNPTQLPAYVLENLAESESEISPFFYDAIECKQEVFTHIHRNQSASFFGEEKVTFSVICTLLNDSFCYSQGHRPYPSAGALYPVEVICCILNQRCLDAPETGIYHYRPSLRLLQPLKVASDLELLNILLNNEQKHYQPSFCLVYVANVLRMLVKYAFRGYRHALIEVGAMVQQADLVGQALGIKNRVFSGFSDYELGSFFQLDPNNFLPIAIQAFGS